MTICTCCTTVTIEDLACGSCGLYQNVFPTSGFGLSSATTKARLHAYQVDDPSSSQDKLEWKLSFSTENDADNYVNPSFLASLEHSILNNNQKGAGYQSHESIQFRLADLKKGHNTTWHLTIEGLLSKRIRNVNKLPKQAKIPNEIDLKIDSPFLNKYVDSIYLTLLSKPDFKVDFGLFNLNSESDIGADCYSFFEIDDVNSQINIKIPFCVLFNQPTPYEKTFIVESIVEAVRPDSMYQFETTSNSKCLGSLTFLGENYSDNNTSLFSFSDASNSSRWFGIIDFTLHFNQNDFRTEKQDRSFVLTVKMPIRAKRLHQLEYSFKCLCIPSPVISVRRPLSNISNSSVRDSFLQEIECGFERIPEWKKFHDLSFYINPVWTSSHDKWIHFAEAKLIKIKPNLDYFYVPVSITVPTDIGEKATAPIEVQIQWHFKDLLGRTLTELSTSKIDFINLTQLSEVVAFDFGTTNTSAVFISQNKKPTSINWAIWENGGETIGKTIESKLIPLDSSNLVNQKGWIVGANIEKSKIQLRFDPRQFQIKNFKKTFYSTIEHQQIGINPEVRIRDVKGNIQSYTPKDALLGILKSFILEAERVNSLKFNRLAFTYPTKWKITTIRQFSNVITSIGKELGITVNPPVTDEGSAVILSYFSTLPLEKKKENKIYISYDLGGGTLDIAAMNIQLQEAKRNRVAKTNYQLIGFKGNPELGSEMFTRVIGNLIYKTYKNKLFSNAFFDRAILNTLVDSAFIIETNDFVNLAIDDGDSIIRSEPSENGKIQVFIPWTEDNDSWLTNLSTEQEELIQKSDFNRYLFEYETDNAGAIFKAAEEIKKSNFSKDKIINELSNLSLRIIVFEGKEVYQNFINDFSKIFLGTPSIGKNDFSKIATDLIFSLDDFLNSKYANFQIRKNQNKTIRQIFEESFEDIYDLVKLSSFLNCKSVEIVLAGNGSKLPYISDVVLNKSILEEKLSKLGIREVNIVLPGEEAKNRVAIGAAQFERYPEFRNLPSVYEVIHNPPFVRVIRPNEEDGNFEYFYDPIITPFTRFSQNLLSEKPSLINNSSQGNIKIHRFEYAHQVDDNNGNSTFISLPIYKSRDNLASRFGSFRVDINDWKQFCFFEDDDGNPQENGILEQSHCKVKFLIDFNWKDRDDLNFKNIIATLHGFIVGHSNDIPIAFQFEDNTCGINSTTLAYYLIALEGEN